MKYIMEFSGNIWIIIIKILNLKIILNLFNNLFLF